MTEKKKLLLVSDTYHPKVDGTVMFIDEFLRRAAAFFNLSLLVPNFGPHKSNKSINTYYLTTSKFISPLPTYPAIRLSLKNFMETKKAVKETDLVTAQGPALASFLAIRYARKYKKKAFFYTHVLFLCIVQTLANCRAKNRYLKQFLKKALFYSIPHQPF